MKERKKSTKDHKIVFLPSLQEYFFSNFVIYLLVGGVFSFLYVLKFKEKQKGSQKTQNSLIRQHT